MLAGLQSQPSSVPIGGTAGNCQFPFACSIGLLLFVAVSSTRGAGFVATLPTARRSSSMRVVLTSSILLAKWMKRVTGCSTFEITDAAPTEPKANRRGCNPDLTLYAPSTNRVQYERKDSRKISLMRVNDRMRCRCSRGNNIGQAERFKEIEIP